MTKGKGVVMLLVAVRNYIANNLLGLVALFVALGGTSYAAVVLKANSVTSKHVAKQAIKSRHIVTGAITSDKVKNSTLKIKDLSPKTVTALSEGESVSGSGGTIPGPEGPAGPQGEPGLDGKSGINDFEIYSSKGNVNSDSTKEWNVLCPNDKVAVGGGGRAIAELVASKSLAISRSEPTSSDLDPSPEGWKVVANEVVEYNKDWHVEVFAVCARVQ